MTVKDLEPLYDYSYWPNRRVFLEYAIRGHGKWRAAGSRYGDAVQDSDGLTGELKAILVKASCEQSGILSKQDVARHVSETGTMAELTFHQRRGSPPSREVR